MTILKIQTIVQYNCLLLPEHLCAIFAAAIHEEQIVRMLIFIYQDWHILMNVITIFVLYM